MQFWSNLFRIISCQKTAFFVAGEGKKSKKLAKIVKIKEFKINIFQETWWMSIRCLGKILT